MTYYRLQGARVYTFFMYLSTPEVGGGTRFTDLNLTVPAVKGSAVLWPSVTSDDPDIDEPLTHRALSQTGEGHSTRATLHGPRRQRAPSGRFGRGWPRLGAAGSTRWRSRRPPAGSARRGLSHLVFRRHHEGLPPERGLKFASNVWLHNFDFRTPADAGCPLCHKNTH